MEPEASQTLTTEEAEYLRRFLIKFLHVERWEDKEDIIQECLKHCCEKVPKYRGDNNAKRTTFLVRVAILKSFDELPCLPGRKKIPVKTRRKILERPWILEQPWIFGIHEQLSKEEYATMREKCAEFVDGKM